MVFAAKGDSGSIVVAEDGTVIGQIHAVVEATGHVIVSPIKAVLSALGCTLVANGDVYVV